MSITAYDLARVIVAELNDRPDTIEVDRHRDYEFTQEAVLVIEKVIADALKTKGIIP